MHSAGWDGVMQVRIVILLGCLAAGLASCSSDSDEQLGCDVERDRGSYQVYESGYGYDASGVDPDTTLFVWVEEYATFDSLFGFIYDHNPCDPVPPGDFLTSSAVAIVKYANDWYELDVRSVGLSGQTLEVHYSSALMAENLTWTPAHPIIVVTDLDFRAVTFLENGVVVHHLDAPTAGGP